jgi:dsRNA-specific ribonuclease
MPLTVIDLDDKTLAQALIKATGRKITFEAFITESIRAALDQEEGNVDAPIDVAAALAAALGAVGNLPSKKEFMLEDIAADWPNLTGGQRKSLGKAFKKAVKDSKPQIAKWLRRTSANKAVYVRT